MFISNAIIKGERNLKMYCALQLRTLQTMDFDINLIKIGGKLRYRQLNI